jgi:small subunit ribosomal protein S7
MPRKGAVPEREVLPDPIYKDIQVTKFINGIMKSGKKSLAEKIFYGALDMVARDTNEDPLQVMKKALKNVEPMVEVKSRRVGGANYQVPVEVRTRRRQSLAIRWLIQYSKERTGKTMAEKLAAELMEAAEGRGGAMKKREDVHRMAEANKAFAHYRW